MCDGIRAFVFCCFFFSSRRRHTRLQGDWSSDVCSSDLSSGATYSPNVAPAALEIFSSISVPPKSLVPACKQASEVRSEERRVGKSVDLGGRRIIKKKKKRNSAQTNTEKQTIRQPSTIHS